ncbi:tricarballylate/proton symporter TcuC [Prauserella flavalba]|uniref:Putative proline/betaine transporter n=1 Tax=Prauserella flavalba TaxID=1477506 RepID=A0A318LA81_9PSEU|nr:tricarballylate/proton symporter TcuC [Prauserella flavalba]PXY18524.1 citrate-proton symporter [Prauserella flavalba]
MSGSRSTANPRSNVIKAAAGNFLEMYDFAVYGFYAGAIATAIFPTGNEFVSTMLSFLTFGVGFLMRPLGAIVLGAYMDRKGRRAGLILSLIIMGISVVILAAVPTYSTIGIAAPILVVFSRLLQGFSAGAESSGVSVYLAEIAKPGRRGFYVSWQSASQQISVVFAALVGVALSAALTQDQLNDWGWRIPFLIGSLVLPFIFWVRRTLPETESFTERTSHSTPSVRTIFRTFASAWPIVSLAVGLVTLTSVMFYLITAYTPTFGERELNLGYLASFVATVCVGLSNFFWIPVMGALSDRVGRTRLLITASALTALAGYPLLTWLTTAPSFGRLLTVLLIFSALYGAYQGAMVVTLTEIMPETVRVTGFAIAYSVAQAIFGGFTPAIATSLIELSGGNAAIPAVWLSFAAVISLGAALIVHKRRLANMGTKAAETPAKQLA